MGKSAPKIGILGGTFDPIHCGHLILAEFAIENFMLDKIIFIPINIPSHKNKPQAPAKHRYNMIKLAIQDNPAFEVSMLEIKRGGISYSYETLEQLHATCKKTNFYFILGADAFNELETWKKYSVLVKQSDFVVATRNGVKIKKLPNARAFKLPIPKIDISASEIRSRIKNNLSIKYLVPERIRDYIQAYNLYK